MLMEARKNCKVNEKQRNQRTAKAGCIIQPASHKTPYSMQPISTGENGTDSKEGWFIACKKYGKRPAVEVREGKRGNSRILRLVDLIGEVGT